MIFLAEKASLVLLLGEEDGASYESKYFLQQGFLQLSEIHIQVCFLCRKKEPTLIITVDFNVLIV